MTFVAQIGDAVQTRAEMRVEWKVENFSSLSENLDNYYESPVFNFADSRWYFRLYPSGQTNGDASLPWLRLSLCNKDPHPSRTVKFTLGVKFPDGKSKKVERTTEDDEWSIFLGTRAALESKIMPDNFLTVVCILACTERDAAKASLSNRLWDVSHNMKNVLADGHHTDFTLKLGSRKWPVHKAILESRSEYFANMFRHDWVENNAGEVTFDDIDEDAMASVLNFLYTGCAEDMSLENVCDIYAAAHKFHLDDLKALCVRFMKENLCVEMLCNVFVIADTYGEGELRRSAIEYVVREADHIFASEEWKRLKQDHLSIVAEILEETTKRRKKRRRTKSEDLLLSIFHQL